MMIKQEKSKKTNLIVILALLVLIFVLEQVVPSSSMLFTVLKKSAIYALAAVSMNLLNGFTGLFSLGQAGFMLVGAYTFGVLNIASADRAAVYQYFDGGIIRFSVVESLSSLLGPVFGLIVGVLLSLIAAGLLAALFAYLIGLPVLRFRGDYLAVATLGFAEIIRAFFQWDALGPITNGSNLLRKFTNLDNFNITNSSGQVVVTLSATALIFLVAICIYVITLLINSTYGRSFKAIRDDEVAAEAMGINLAKHKMLSFVISAFFAGIAGGMLAMYQTTVQAMAFKVAMTYEILLIVVIGGIGSVTGSCLSAFIFVGASEWWLRFLDEEKFNIPGLNILRPGFRKVVFSIAIMIVVLFFRKGIMGENELNLAGLGRWLKRKFAKKKAPAAGKEDEDHA
ncbi:MAG: branched-chain amino acid ABC transporter permease [Oscillospiraceae bacterium]|nr:branched-chain amino acid ABC transporter permease [Oscillospiraceae bacterium]